MTFPTFSPPWVRARKVRLSTVAGSAALLLLAGGCGQDSPAETRETPSSSPSPTPSASASASASATPSTSATATARASATPAPNAGPLLSKTEMPGFNETYKWRASVDSDGAEHSFGACAKFGLKSVGATSVRQRRYLPPRGATTTRDTAAVQFATFPDEMTAQRAAAVVDAWRKDCAARLPGSGAKRVSPWTPVVVDSGQAKAFLAQWPAGGDDGFFEEVGVVRAGNLMALVQIRHVGQDHNYESGAEPIARALALVAPRLG